MKTHAEISQHRIPIVGALTGIWLPLSPPSRYFENPPLPPTEQHIGSFNGTFIEMSNGLRQNS
jgi:hypothetical protein